jgi:hypothetical protein
MVAAATRGESEPTPNDSLRREVLDVLAALGPHLLAASRAIDGPTPRDALAALHHAALALAPYLT